MAPCMVLNAFRHHWNLHTRVYASHHAQDWCSTPFGITGIFTHSDGLSAMLGRGAQRLSASLESSRRDSAPGSTRRAQRLSASLESSRLSGCLRAGVSSAQRLSASLIFTRQPSDSALALVLNALRHHCNLHRQRQYGVRTQAWCSTPFGITEIFTWQCTRWPGKQVLNALRHH